MQAGDGIFDSYSDDGVSAFIGVQHIEVPNLLIVSQFLNSKSTRTLAVFDCLLVQV